MVQKRPFDDEDSFEVSSKHPRQLDYSNQLGSSLDFVRAEDMSQQPNVSVGEGKGSLTDGNEKHARDIITELPICTEMYSEIHVPGCISNTSWASSSTSKEDDGSKAPFHLLFSQEYYNADRPIRTLVHSEEICTSVLKFTPQKLVPIGPDFQAVLPEWGCSENACDSSDGFEPLTLFPQALESDLSDRNYVENKLAGNCVIPMPEFDSSACNHDKVGDGRTDCYCEDSGSLRCVRHHIKESREKVWRTLGQERFSELGFSDMGEVVADKWSREEEILFREVVFSNPALLGKNFWDHLSMVFPTRAKKDIVSYYFNVFMLQRRAAQNRYDPMNIDSDDDEWQGSDDDSGDDEDEDSVVEFPECSNDSGHQDILENDSQYNECVPWAGFSNNYENITEGCEKSTGNVLETYSRKLLCDTLRLPGNHHLWDKKDDHGSCQDEKGDPGSQDDSCTSSDAGTTRQGRQAKGDNSKCSLGSFTSTSCSGDSHEFALEHCDAKVWDVGYLTFPKPELEFLPTCSVIEEVFGVGSWNYMTSDTKDLS